MEAEICFLGFPRLLGLVSNVTAWNRKVIHYEIESKFLLVLYPLRGGARTTSSLLLLAHEECLAGQTHSKSIRVAY